MPVAKIENIGSDALVGVWNITEDWKQLFEMIDLTLDELNHFHRVKHETKKREWLASRILCKTLVEHLDQPYSGIWKDDFEKPNLNDLDIKISLSHSFPYAVAYISKRIEVGIDIERPRKNLQRIKHKFLSESEWRDAGESIEKLCLYWSAKESLYKVYGKKKLAFKEEIFVDPFETHPVKGGYLEAGKWIKCELMTIEHDGFFVTFNV